MRNAKEELLKIISTSDIKCAFIYERDEYNYETNQYETQNPKELKVNHSDEELDIFINSLDFNYDSGFGGQELYGIVWMNDGTWLERGEYDGSEWWEHKVCPKIPNELI